MRGRGRGHERGDEQEAVKLFAALLLSCVTSNVEQLQ